MSLDPRIKAIQDKADKIRDEIANGNCRDFAEYRQKVGERKGMMMSLGILRDPIHRSTDQDDD